MSNASGKVKPVDLRSLLDRLTAGLGLAVLLARHRAVATAERREPLVRRTRD
jgi:hypothetical protein